MAKNGGAYFPIHAGFCRDRAARRLRRSHGWEGVGQYVGLLCMLLEEPGNALDVMADADMADLADELGCESAADCADLLRDMASSGMIDAASLASGVVRAPMVDEAIKTYEEATARARETGRIGGIRSGEARRRKAAERRASEGGLEGAFDSDEGGLQGPLNHK